jgi:4-carboxymuconolactone decarboxylase
MSQADSTPAGVQTESAEDLLRREELILGKSPRISPLELHEIAEVALENIRNIRRATGNSNPILSTADVPEVVRTLLRHPDLYQRVAAVSIQLIGNGTLTPRDRELVILRTAWLCQAPYAWGEHVRVGKRFGLNTEDCERVTQGSSVSGWNEDELALLRATEELHSDAMISDATWEVLSKRLDDKQLFELTVLVGQFTTVAYFQNALRLRLAPDNIGLRAR